MRRALRRAALALLAAGASGMPRPAVAQQLPPAASMSLPPADTLLEGRGKLEEMKVEMAWLADSATFPYPLAARTVDGKLEVRGYVPSETAQEKALKIARMHTHFVVVSALQINRELTPRETGIAVDAVRQGAVEVLSESFGMAARGFEIRAESNGQVAVSGSVNSVEEKLAVSRKLRKARGCTCVSNYLQISPIMRDGRMVTQINAAGSLVVPGQVLCLDGTGQEPSAPRPMVVTTIPAAPVRTRVLTPTPPPPSVVVTMPTPMPPPPRVVVTVPTQPRTQPVSEPRPLSGYGVMQVQPVSAPVQPLIVSAAPSVVYPIEVPLPPAATSAPSRTITGGADLVLPPPPVSSRFDVAPRAVPLPPPQPQQPPRPAVALPRDSSTNAAASAIRIEKDVDLLAVPTVPETWTRSTTPPPPVTKPKPKGPTTFAIARAEPARTLTADELLSLPAVPLGADGKPVGVPARKAVIPAKPVTPAMPITAKPVTPPTPVTAKPVPAVVPIPSKPAAPAVVVAIPAKPAVVTPVQATTLPSPAVKPLPLPQSAPFKDTWVEAVPAPAPVSKPDHPLPPSGGWPAAHIARPAPTAYVTSGVVVFPDDSPPAVKPAPVTVQAPVLKPTPVAVPAPAMKPVPVIAPAPRIQPVAVPPALAPTSSGTFPSGPAPLHMTQPPVLTSVPAATTPSATKLRQQVEKACGRLASQIEVTPTDKGLTVRVRCVDSATAQKVMERVLVQVPEMMDVKVKFEVNVGP